MHFIALIRNSGDDKTRDSILVDRYRQVPCVFVQRDRA